MAQSKITYSDKNETGCCPVPNVKDWDESKVVWKDKKFIKDYTFNFLHIPLNMGVVVKRMWKKIEDAKAAPPTNEWMLLSYDLSPWKGEHYCTVTKDVPNAELQQPLPIELRPTRATQKPTWQSESAAETQTSG